MDVPREDPLTDFLAQTRAPGSARDDADDPALEPGPVDSDVEAAEAELDAYHDELAAAEVRAAVETTDRGWDASFEVETLDPATARYGEPTTTEPTCQWCHAELPVADAARCPTCAAILQPLDADADLPGVTSVSDRMRVALEQVEFRRKLAHVDSGEMESAPDPELLARRQVPPQDLFSGPVPPESYAPPGPDVRQMMQQILLETIEADPVAFVDPGPLSDDHGG